MFGLRSPHAQCRKAMQYHHIDIHMRYVYKLDNSRDFKGKTIGYDFKSGCLGPNWYRSFTLTQK